MESYLIRTAVRALQEREALARVKAVPATEQITVADLKGTVLAEQVALAVAEGQAVYEPGQPCEVDPDAALKVWTFQQVGINLPDTVQLMREPGTDLGAYNKWMQSIN